jgi:hypothetical protein
MELIIFWLITLSILWLASIIFGIYIYKQTNKNYILLLKLRARLNKITDTGDHVSMKLDLKRTKREPLIVDSSSLDQRIGL